MYEHSSTTLADLIGKRRKCLTQLRDLGIRQARHIATGEMSELLRLFGAKQQLINALQSLEQQLEPFHSENPDARFWESQGLRAQCAADAEACRELIVQVMAMEQDGERQMIARRDEVAQQLRSVATGGRVHEAYQANR